MSALEEARTIVREAVKEAARSARHRAQLREQVKGLEDRVSDPHVYPGAAEDKAIARAALKRCRVLLADAEAARHLNRKRVKAAYAELAIAEARAQ